MLQNFFRILLSPASGYSGCTRRSCFCQSIQCLIVFATEYITQTQQMQAKNNAFLWKTVDSYAWWRYNLFMICATVEYPFGLRRLQLVSGYYTDTVKYLCGNNPPHSTIPRIIVIIGHKDVWMRTCRRLLAPTGYRSRGIRLRKLIPALDL